MNKLMEQSELTVTTFVFWQQMNEFRKEVKVNEIRHGDFLARVEDEIDDLGDCDNFAHPQNKKPTRFYNLNKDQCLLVGMRESKLIRKRVLNWINSLQDNNQKFYIPQTYGDALQLCADQARELELAKPKVAFVDNLVDKTNLLNASQIGQKHKLSAIKLNRILKELDVYNGTIKRTKVFKQWFIDKGFGEMKKTEQGFDQALFTNTGEIWINEKLITESVV